MSLLDQEAEDARLNNAAGHLHARLVARVYKHGRRFTPNCIHDLVICVKEHRRECARRGIAFPEMALVILPEQGAVEAIRRDSTREAIQQHILNWTVKHPNVTPQEIGAAILRAFPEFRPQQFDVVRRPPKMVTANAA